MANITSEGHHFPVSAGFLELGLQFFGFCLFHAFLDVRGHALDQVLGFLEAKARDRADGLDDGNLVATKARENDIELVLLFGGSGFAYADLAAAYGPT